MDEKDRETSAEPNRDVDFLATERIISNVGTGFIGVGLLIHSVNMLRISYFAVKYIVFGP